MNAPDYREYLGDGVYVELEDGMLRLSTDRMSYEHIIYLEQEVFQNLIEYEKRLTLALLNASVPARITGETKENQNQNE